MPKSEAEARLAVILKPLNEGAGQSQTPIYTFGVYLQEIFLPGVRRKWKESTRMTSEPTIRGHLVPAFGDTPMNDLTRDSMQAFLDKMAKTHSSSVVGHLRWHLSGIFKMALGDGVVDLNPTSGLYTPACKSPAEKLVMSREHIVLALKTLDLRERLIFRMAVFDGMRPGEILAIRVGNISDHSILINQRLYKGNLDSPKGRKGKRTSRTVALSPGTKADLREWCSRLGERPSDAFLFPSDNLRTPMRRDNLWYRCMRPKLKPAGLEWATFQVLRRTNASLGRKALIDDKVAADQRGHGLGVSLEVYSVSDLQQKIEAVKKIESEVIQ